MRYAIITNRTRRALALATPFLFVLAASACGSDDDGGASDDSTAQDTTAPAPSTAAAGGFDADAYCAAELALEQAAGASGGPETDPLVQAATLLELAQPARAAAPAELQPAFDRTIATVESAIETGNPEPLFSIDTSDIHEFDLANCGWNAVEVSMQDYHFMGLPDTLPAGVTSVEVTNDGSEAHVLTLVKKKEGVTDSWEALLASPDGESKVDTISSAFAEPGGTGYGVFDLPPGEYLALCPIPEGTTAGAEGTGAPHFVLGMQHVVTVS